MGSEPRRNSCKGFLAGAVGGLVASFAMGQFYLLLPKAETPAQQGTEDSTVKAAGAISQNVFHHKLAPQQKMIAGPMMHYGFGVSVAAIYGAVAEFAPVVRNGWGMPFGVGVWLAAHVIAVPALGLSKPVYRVEPAEGSRRIWGTSCIWSGGGEPQASTAKAYTPLMLLSTRTSLLASGFQQVL
jgi:putative membrane protein